MNALTVVSCAWSTTTDDGVTSTVVTVTAITSPTTTVSPTATGTGDGNSTDKGNTTVTTQLSSITTDNGKIPENGGSDR